jgi:hypothetical protein
VRPKTIPGFLSAEAIVPRGLKVRGGHAEPGSAPRTAGWAIWWSTTESGGGASSGGGYTLMGTIGQPDAGMLTGGGYTLSGGFWPGAAGSYRIYLPLVSKG